MATTTTTTTTTTMHQHDESAGETPGQVQQEDDDFVFKLQPEHKAAFRNYLRIFHYATVLDFFVLGASCLAAVAGGLTMPLMYTLFGRLIGTFTDFFKQGAEETQAEFLEGVNETVLQIVYVFAAKLVFTYLSNLGFRATSLRVSAAIRVAYLRALFALPVSTLDMLPTGQTAAIVTTVANNLQLGISEKLGQLVGGAATVGGSLAVALGCNLLLTLATSLGLVGVAFAYAHYTPQITRILNEVMALDIQASAVAAETLAPSAARMLAACGAGDKMAARYASLVDEGRRRGKGMAKAMAFQNGWIFFTVYAIFALAFWYAFQMYMLLEITSPEPLIVVLLSTILTATSIGQLSGPLSAATQAADALVIFHTIIDFPKPIYGTATDVSATGDITLENVHFAYPARSEAKILNGLNVTFPAGKVTAIVGPSGSGKSTIVGIIQRWYEFNGDPVLNPLVLYFRTGLVSVSGRRLTEIDPKWWRAQIGLVQQDNVLFDTSVYKNVEYGLVGTQWEYASDKVKARMIKAACRDAFADEFISRLPLGYQTTVGQTGMKLSGGQRQRLAIARAIVKRPSILILDEATSAIDVRSEGIVQAALDRASKGRTTIVIAHRLATIRKADNIVVLREGQIVQSGTHEDLVADAEGVYHGLATAQKVDVAAAQDGNDAMMEEEEFEEKLRPLSPGTTWTEETLTVGKEEIPMMGLSPTGRQREVGEDDDDDDLNELEGLVRVVGSPGSRGTLWTIFSEQAFRWNLYIIMLLGAAAAGSATPLQAYLFATLISLFSFWGNFLAATVNFWVLMMFLLSVGVGFGHAALGWSTTELGFAVTRAYRKEYFGNLLAKPASFFDDDENNSAGTLAGRLSTDPTQLQQLVGMSLASLVTSVFNLVGCILIALVFGWKLTLVSLIMTLPVVLVAMIYRVRYEMSLDAMSTAVFAESARFACESIGAIRTAVSLTLEDDICQRYELLLRNHIKDAFHGARVSVLLFALSDSIPLLCMAFVLWYGAQLLASHEYEPFQYMVVYISVLQGGMSAGQWLSFGPNIANATSAAERILSTREDVEDSSILDVDVNPSSESEKPGVDLEFRNVSFQYPTRAVAVLSGLDLKIHKGQFAAIVGPSGCGKSTIVSLLERFYSPQRGQILQDGTDIANKSLATYRHGLSLVAQDPCLFSGTIRENILLGIPAGAMAKVTGDDIQRAAQDAGIHEFISSLPEGYNTAVGTGGLALSGGQKQRVSLARALIRRPRLLLLDEATSSLDSQTEAHVQAALEGMKGQMTMVVVAHRLATVRKADVIFVMGEGGMLIEQGDHDDLVARRGVYYEMCQSQALDQQ